VQILARCLMLHGNSLQPTKLAHHIDGQVPLHYIIVNEREHGSPYVLVMPANGVEGHTLDLIGLVWLPSNL
jgi:hypothetical protein